MEYTIINDPEKTVDKKNPVPFDHPKTLKSCQQR